ncbi:MAG TPA: amino acid adenylation domain-containing protein [Verrucomicrobiae bacterium]|nr:amino acid adenylation domain-containing protein [Verrucomicrobiae bacterium]
MSQTSTRSSERRTLLQEQLRQASVAPEIIPLSFAQQRLWLIDQLEPNSALYNVPLAIELNGALDVNALQTALDELVSRHEILRTRFNCEEEVPMQLVDDESRVKISFHDFTSAESDHREDSAQRALHAEVIRPFDLASGPVFRAALIRLAPERHWLALTFHHIVSDEWSLKVCLRELTTLYGNARKGTLTPLPELPIQYADFALWQRDKIQGELLEKQLAYWREQLRGNPPLLELPSDQPRSALPTFRGQTLTHPLPRNLENGLKDLAGRNGASLFMVLLAGFQTLLRRYTQQTDILIGSPIAGRNQLETEDLIGFFVNTLVLRTDLSGNPTFTELLQRVRETTLGAYANQDLPFEKIVEALRPERTLNHNPFTRIMFAVQNHGLDEVHWPGLDARVLEVETGTAKFDLTFIVQETARGLVARVEFNRDLFHADSMQRLLAHFETVLEGIVAEPQRRLSELPLTTLSERRTMLHDWNATQTQYPNDCSVAQLFEAQVERTPHDIAVAYGKETLTYSELNARANQLARHLIKMSVGAETPVALCLERSPRLIVAMLAILKAGGAYVPLDPSYPKARLAQMLADSKPPVLITQQNLLNFLPRGGTRVLCIDSDWELIAPESKENPLPRATAENVAYIIYTSGSTGQPKGVAIPHRAIARLVLNTNYVQLSADDCIAQASNTSFDAATFEIWGALLNGAKLAGISMDIALSPKDFARELREQKISVLFLTTALFNQIAAEKPDAFSAARVVMFGGEAVDPKWVRAVLKHPPQHLLHVYGPTENTTFSTWHEIREVAPDATTIPIGKPLANSECFILDSDLNPAPVGVPGELHVAGDGLARGYWNQPELSREKFIPNPYRDGNGAPLLYKTGDLARWLADGTIEFIGRLDHQVKLRGFRVELSEIESLLAQHPGVRECVVTVHAHGSDKKLAAYFVPQGRRSPSVPELRQFLKKKLPEYMVPSAFVRLSSLPLTPNGKVDRKALPEPDRARPELEKRYATPQDAVELELTRIWESVLGIHPIGIQDKFFELGGHSLLAVRVIAQIEKQFGRKLKLATIFQAQTIEQLAAILRKEIQEDSAISGTSLVEIQPKGSRLPLYFVHGAGGGMFWGYVNLSRHLGPDQPVFGLRSRGLDGREEFQTIEQMAAQYVSDLRVIQPRGPYRIGGYCFGGNVAYEMARQLEAQGETVETLALFNCAPANSRYSRLTWSPRWFFRFGVNLCYWARYFLNWTPPQRREFFRWKKEMLKRRADRFLGHSKKSKATVDAGELVDLSSYSDEQRKLWECHIHALVNYHPKPFSGRVQLFRSPGHPLLCSFDADYGWGDLAQGGVQITVVPGVHEKILEEPCVGVLARKLKRLLTQSKTKPTVNDQSTAPAVTPPVSTSADSPILKWNQTRVSFPIEGSYAVHFEKQVARTPDAMALRSDGKELSYAELNARANQLARQLQTQGVGPETLVAVCIERSLELPIALLAVLKAGGAYLPLDRSYPTERLAYMLGDSKAPVLLTQSAFADELKSENTNVICLDDPQQQKQIAAQSTENFPCPANLENLAYIIYTSGSTGAPKGVQIPHRALLNHNFAIAEAFQLSPADRTLQFSPFSFDISVEELFPAWLRGCGVVMRRDDDISSTGRFLKFLTDEQITVANIPTAYWHELVEHLRSETLPPGLRLMIIGGEKASNESWRRWKERVESKVTLINAYGPTEATVTATLHVGKMSDETLPIGHPLANAQALILNEQLAPVPLGEEGELHIGGAGLARGYLNRPELTAQKFIPNPFPEIPSERLYKTGDRARYRPDGSIEFSGRNDEQVKLRGYRIELGEIENSLRSHPGVKDCVVTAREDFPGKKRLAAYFVPRTENAPGVGELLEYLKGKLPSYMVPSCFVPLAALPLSPSGKVDRQNLPKPGDSRPELSQKYVAPRTPIEEVIASIWGEVLGINRVGIHDNFFDLGGHSLLATQVISRMRETLQVEVPLLSLFTLPTVGALAERLGDAANQTQPVLPASAVSKGRQLPLTLDQKRIWFLDQFEPKRSSYNIPTALRLKGALNVPALEKSLSELAQRHDALRTVFPADDGQPIQLICEPKAIQLSVTDLSDVPPEERERRAGSLAVTESHRSYAMSNPMLRTFLWRFDAEDHLLLIITHELACDAQSVRNLYAELLELYQANVTGTVAQLSPLKVEYAETATLRKLSPDEEQKRFAFWKQQLAGAPELIELPSDRPRPVHQGDDGSCEPIAFSIETTAAVEALSREMGCAPFATLLAAFQTLLARYTGSTDILVGSTVSNRARWELNHVIAKLDNTIVLRSDLSGQPTFRDLLQRVHKTHEAALANSDLSFARLLEEIRPPRNASHTPVFQVMFSYDPEPLPPREVAGVNFRPLKIYNETAKLDLQLCLAQSPQGLCGWIEYSTALFDAERIARMAGHLQTLLAAALKNPDQPVATLPLMPETEARQVVVDWNATQKPYPTTATLMNLFEAQVARTPDAIALIAGNEELSYAELNARANQLARHLRELGVGPEKMAGICLERSWRLLVAILGVLKAGGAYVPLDPAYPKERLAFILEDAGAPVLLTQESLRPLLGAAVHSAQIVALDSDWPQIHTHSRENLDAAASSKDLAYVIYTSGSTGKPKGVAIENRAAVALMHWAKEVFTAEEISGVLASTSVCFDLSIFEMFVPLSWGGTVILAQNALALPTLAAAERVTLINTVPSAIRELLRVKGIPPNVRVVNIAGEPLATSVVNQIYAQTTAQKVYDLYGPSETTTYSTFTLRQPNEPATIGKPLANEQVYLLDTNRQPVPIGIPGELYIGGDKLARGYLNRPELTAEKFVSNPFNPGTRLYRTGDLARWRADGQLEYLGRIDHQVKIRGFRIELGEIETAFRNHPALRDVVVLARENQNGSKRLVAYLVAKSDQRITTEELRRFGKEHLPDYMVPSAFVLLPELPLTPNGKIDRKALPDPEHDPREDSASYVAPRTPVEEQLVSIWREVLHVERAGVHDNFFELGGDSLLAIQVISRVRETCKVELPLFSLFDAPTIETLAQGLQSGQWTQNQLPVLPLQALPRGGALPVSFVQERLWFLDQLEPGNHSYNVAAALRFKGNLNVVALEKAFTEIAKRHETLRTTFAHDGENLVQKIAEPQPFPIELTDLSAEPEDRLAAWLKTESQRPFDLANGPLTRVRLARLAEHDHALAVVMHHTISDGWSLTILFQELEAFYRAFAGGKSTPALPALTLQYADFAAWKRQQMQGAALDLELNFWKEKLKGAPAAIALPTDHSEPETTTLHAKRAVLNFSKATSEAIGQLSHRQNTTAFVILTAALSAVLEKWTHQRDLVIGTVVAGRNRREMEAVIGCFMNFLPIRTRLSGDETGEQLLAKVKAAVLEAQEHQDCPFEKIVEAVNPERRQNQNPLYNVALLLQNFPSEMFKSDHLEVSQLPVDLEAALLDLRFEAEWTKSGLTLACEYKTDLFETETIREFLNSYEQILETLIRQPETRLPEFRITEALENQSRAARSRRTEQTIAIAATFTAEPIEESLRYWAKELELAADVEFAPFNQVFQELLDPASLLNGNTRGLNVLLIRAEDWIKAGVHDSAQVDDLSAVAGEFLKALKTSAARSTTPFLIVLCPPSHAIAADPKRRTMVEATENFLASETEKVNGAHVITTGELLKLYSVADYYDASGDELGKVPFTPVFFTALGTMIARKLHALQRAPHKVIVLDCDNTLWSGVCGEDGAAGICLDAPRKALQEFMCAQQQAGRLLAVCSKNNEEDVREVFAKRLDMPLKHDHFAAWKTNWLPKSENLKALARELNLGLDSFIFVDDNPVECAEVEANCPDVLTLQLPENPEEIPAFLQHCWAFDQAKLTAEDRQRAGMYRDQQEREKLRANANGLAEFIASLDLKIDIAPMSAEQLTRVSQLTHRTNQFNCTTIRRTETEIQSLANSSDILIVKVRDRFGDYGLVGVVIASNHGAMLDVETFLLSCRVLGRGVEHAILAHLGKLALERELEWVDVHYHRSEKNKPAHDFLESIGANYRQALNGGFIYRFPARVAAETVFLADKSETESNIQVATFNSQRASASDGSALQVESSRRSSSFRNYRQLALEANDPARIHAAVESRAKTRSGKQSGYVPPNTETERQLCDIWEKLLRVERVGLKDNFFELGGHSLLAVRLFAELEKLSGRKFPLVTIFQAPTVEQLAAVLSENHSERAQSPIVAVQPNGDRPPLFLAHGAGGDVLWGYANLAKHLPADQPIYGIKSRGQIGLEEFDRIEDMARYYIEEIRAFQPNGPYYLGGYCLGGNVAYEMARQLRALGEEVAVVLLIDAFPSNVGYERITWWRPSFAYRFSQNFWYWLQDFRQLSVSDQRRFILRKTRILGRKLLARLRKKSGASVEVDLEEVIDPAYFPEHELKFWEIHLRALTNHVDQPYPGAVTLIRTRGQPLLCSFADDFCWGHVARGGVTIKRIPGSHENIFIEPNVKFLAEQLQASLAEAHAAAAQTNNK